jgi:hypothetical protein
MERRFRNLQSPKYLGSDKRFKAREQEGVSAQRKRQGFDVAVNPLSGQPGSPRSKMVISASLMSGSNCPKTLTVVSLLAGEARSSTKTRDTPVFLYLFVTTRFR